MSGGNPLGNNPAASTELTAKYSKLFLDYKLAVNGAHFRSGLTLSGAPLFTWQGPAGISACEEPPLQRLLAAPRLAPDLQQYLQPQQQPQQQQQQQQH